MKIIRSRFDFATIALISGHPRFDRTAARIMDAIQEQSSERIDFVGVIGDNYSKNMHKRFASSSLLDHEEVVITRHYLQAIQDSWLNPYRAITHYKNSQLLKELDRSRFYDYLHQKNVGAVISVGNFSLMNRVYTKITKEFQSKGAVKPLRLSFDLLNADRTIGNEDFLDFVYHNLPKLPENLTKYVFPSMCIGYEGLFHAFQFLQKYRADPQVDSFKSTEFSYEVSQLVNKAREEYRTANGINNDQYVTLLVPGNAEKDIEFSFKTFAEGIVKFAERPEISTVNRQFFKVLVLLPQENSAASLIKQRIGSLPPDFAVTLVEAKDKYAALCASDFGFLHNGEITVEAAACQLPSLVVNSCSNYNAYISYLYNGHCSPLNVSTNFEGYQDLMGSLTAIGNKTSSIMVEHFQRPKLRYHYVKLYREQIQKMLAMMGHNPELKVSQTGLQVAAKDILAKLKAAEQLTSDVGHYERKQKLHLF